MERVGFDPAEKALIDASVTRILEVVPELAGAMARSLQEQIPELGGPDDRVALAIGRRSCEAVVRELCAMLRDGSPRSPREAPPAIAEHASLMRRRGVHPDAVQRAYDHVLEMFQRVLMTEMRRMDRADDRAENALGSVGRLVSDWFERTATHITADAVGAPTSSSQIPANRTAPGGHMQAEQLLDKMWDALSHASHDKHISERLALADVTVRLNVAEADGLGVTLLFDRDPIALEQDAPGDVEITLPTADLEELWSEEYNLALAIAQGRVEAHGPVRRFLRVVPIVSSVLRGADGQANGRADAWSGLNAGADDEYAVDGNGMDTGRASFDDHDRALLDHAADYAFHEGALEVAEEHPGSYWSIQFIDTYKRFGANKVLAGLNLGIPEGMITVILGPSGVGKSVTIKHIVGLLFPDAGDVIVHGRSVLDRTRSELFEMRRGFGMLFQDGALFGSMNLYDNVAFPLREHTTKRESEIREIVMGRLEEVGLADAIDRMPNELSGGMRKRAGFARALVLEPEVVIFDEPDSGLDPVRTALLVELIRELHSRHGGTYIVVTHDIESARALGGYIAVLWKGRIVQAGEHRKMFDSENPFVRQFLNRETVGPLGMR